MSSKLFEQFVKFGLIGLTNTAISLLTYYLLVWFGCHYIFANAAGFLLSVGNAYFWNGRYVFKEKTETSQIRAFGKVFMTYLGSLCISTVLIAVMVDVLRISEFIAPILRLVVTVPINFVVNKFWAFRDRSK